MFTNYELRKPLDNDKFLRVSFHQKKDGSFTIKTYSIKYPHIVEKLIHCNREKATNAWKKLVDDGFVEF